MLAGRPAEVAVANGDALSLAGGWAAFTQARARVVQPDGSRTVAAGSVAALLDWIPGTKGVEQTLRNLTTAPAPFAGLNADGDAGPLVMGIINATPDSFHPDSRKNAVGDAYELAVRMRDAGADIIDVGGESTRPGAVPVDPADELDRVVPIVEKLSANGMIVSVDTRNAATMHAAVTAGARIVNDVSALTNDEGAIDAVISSGGSVVLMHMHGQPDTMQLTPTYSDVLWEVCGFLQRRITACEAAGIERSRVCVDPGIGFGKTAQHCAILLSGLGALHGLGCTVMVGASRKSFIAGLSQNEGTEDRLPGSLAAACAAARAGVQIVRVHDVPETKQALRIWQEISAH